MDYSETTCTTRPMSSVASVSSSTIHSHDSWAATDEINAQTELFNRRQNERMLEKTKMDAKMRRDMRSFTFEDDGNMAKARSDDEIFSRPRLPRRNSVY